MSLRPQPVPPVPDETDRVARAAFPKGNIFMLLRDEIGTLTSDEDFATLFPSHGRPAEAPWRLALVTVFQFIEGLSDRAAADAVRSRIDWKYALSLELTDSGFDSTVLCEFRARLVAGGAEQLLFDKLLDVCRQRKWLRARGRIRGQYPCEGGRGRWTGGRRDVRDRRRRGRWRQPRGDAPV